MLLCRDSLEFAKDLWFHPSRELSRELSSSRVLGEQSRISIGWNCVFLRGTHISAGNGFCIEDVEETEVLSSLELWMINIWGLETHRWGAR